jgi:hypothetical protein
MKHIAIYVTILFCTAAGCKKGDLTNAYNFKATVVSQLTNEHIAGTQIHVEVDSKQYGITPYDVVLDSFTLVSDNNGNVFCNIKYNDDPYIGVKFFKADDAYTTGLLPQKTEFSVKDLKTAAPLILYVRKYTGLKITVKSTNSFNDNDAIGVSINQDNTNYFNNIIDSIQNFGTINQPLSYPATNDGNNPYWVGQNVNSIIYGKIQEGTTYQITWDVRKNGINTDYKSPVLNTSGNTLNSYNIVY